MKINVALGVYRRYRFRGKDVRLTENQLKALQSLYPIDTMSEAEFIAECQSLQSKEVASVMRGENLSDYELTLSS